MSDDTPLPASSSSSPPALVPTPLESLIAAIRTNDLAAFDAILAATPALDVNKRTSEGAVALVEACRFARYEMAQRLLSECKADVNVASGAASGKARGPTGLQAIHAACMALRLDLVELLLAAPGQRVDLTKVYDVAPPAMMCVFFCVANGYTIEQQQKALAILERLIAYAKRHDGLWDTLLQLETENGNRLVHAAAMVANHAALEMLLAAGADASTRSGSGYSLVQLVENNAFALRAAAEREVKVNHRKPNAAKALDRDVERTEVTATLAVLLRRSSIGALLSRKSDEGARGLDIKWLILAHVGVVAAINEPEKPAYVDAVMHTTASLYTAALRSSKSYGSLWQQALADVETRGLTAASVSTVLDALLGHSSLSRRVRVWMLLLTRSFRLWEANAGSDDAGKTELAVQALASDAVLTRVAHAASRSATKMIFSIYDRTEIDEDESYDEEVEFHLFIALTEMLVQLFTALAPRRPDLTDQAQLAECFARVTAPLQSLWSLLQPALQTLEESFGTPQRFSLVLHVLQTIAIMEDALRQPEPNAWKSCVKAVRDFAKREANNRSVSYETAKQVKLLHSIAQALPLPSSFVSRLVPLKRHLDVLLRSDAKILGLDLYALAHIDGLVSLEHKVEYLVVLAEEQSNSVHVSISRASGANYVEFIVQQILSTPPSRLKGELDVVLVNEPGVGAGVVREFFQLVQQSLFNPEFQGLDDSLVDSAPARHVSEIGSQWLQMARDRSPRGRRANAGRHSKRAADDKDAAGSRSDFTRFFPLFECVNSPSDEFRLKARLPRVARDVWLAKQAKQELHLTANDLLQDADEAQALSKLYQCAGRLLGFAIRDQQPLDANFPLAFWQFILHEAVPWEAYCGSNDVFRRSLQFVLDHDFDAAPLDMRFEYTTDVLVVGKPGEDTEVVQMEMELQRGKGNVLVDNKNKKHYVRLRAEQFFFGYELPYFKKLRDGLYDTIERKDLRLFSAAELHKVIRGDREIDLAGLKQAVQYSHGASPTHPVVQNFWQVVEEFDQTQKEMLLTFWSGSARPPLFGFDPNRRTTSAHHGSWYMDLEPKTKVDLCPTANTCDRRLMLPPYPTKDILREKLLVALEHGAIGYDRIPTTAKMKQIISQILQEKLEGATYQSDRASALTKELADAIKAQLKACNFTRCKYVVQVVIGEQRGEGVRMGCRCFWDPETDCYASETYSNDGLFCVATAYSVYLY
ncbi:hypothetical protein ATCC90586_006653 [Pythium insidiosum]|nr:hypothetical protein ATCC90586_006653 [Pythium insidiosum]